MATALQLSKDPKNKIVVLESASKLPIGGCPLVAPGLGAPMTHQSFFKVIKGLFFATTPNSIFIKDTFF